MGDISNDLILAVLSIQLLRTMINCAKKLRCFTCSLIAEQKFPCTKHVLPSKQRKSVALLIETSKAYSRVLLEGIVEYQRERDSWSIFLPEQERGAAPSN